MKNIKKVLRLIQSIWIIGLLFVLTAGFFLISPMAQAFTFTTIDPKGSTHTVATWINSEGDIVGYYIDSKSVTHGFLRDEKGHYTKIDPPAPGFTYSSPNGINSVGEIVGDYADSNFVIHGFLRDENGHFTTFDPPQVPLSQMA